MSEPSGDAGAMRGVLSRVRSASRSEGVRLAGGSAFLFACRIFGAGSVYLTQAVISRTLGKEALGHYALSFSWCLVVTELALLGMPASAVRFVGAGLADPDEARGRAQVRGFVRRGRQLSAATSVSFAALVALGSLLLLPADSTARAVLLIAMVGVPLMAVIRLNGSIAMAASWFIQFGLPNNVVRPGLFLLLTAVLLRADLGLGVVHVMGLHVAIMLPIAIVVAAVANRRLRGAVGDGAPRYETSLWIRTSRPLLLASLASAYLPDVALITMGRFLPAGDIAQFSAAFRTAFFIAFGCIAVDFASLPRFSRAFGRDDREALQREVTRATRLKFAGALFGFGLLWAYGDSVLGVFGAEFRSGHGALLVLAGAQVVPAFLGPGSQLLGITGHQEVSKRAAVAGLVLVPTLLAFLAPRYGVGGAAWAVLGTNVAISLWLSRAVARRLSIRPTAVG